jgi:hypothetical protein
MKEVSHVYETNDYSMFKTLEGNREINQLHIRRLVKSFGESYLFSPIIINEKYEVIDGQHRIQAAKELKLPFRVIICKGYGMHEIQRLNTNMKNWKREDYLDGYCDLKYPEYLKFRNFMRRFPEFGIQVSELFLTQNITQKKDYSLVVKRGDIPLSRYFEEGKLQIPNYDKSCEIAEIVMLFKPFYDGFNRRLFVSAIVQFLEKPEFSYSELLSKLKYNPNSIQHCTTVTQYKLLIEDIYNYRRREKVNLRY